MIMYRCIVCIFGKFAWLFTRIKKCKKNPSGSRLRISFVRRPASDRVTLALPPSTVLRSPVSVDPRPNRRGSYSVRSSPVQRPLTTSLYAFVDDNASAVKRGWQSSEISHTIFSGNFKKASGGRVWGIRGLGDGQRRARK